MLDDFLIRAALAALGTALAAGALGCFVVWRRMAYFGDATAHAAILGVALLLALEVSVFVGVVAIAVVMALVLMRLDQRGQPMDTALGVLAHGGLAAGLVAISLTGGPAAGVETYLFGNVLFVSKADLGVIWTGVVLVLGLLWWHWPALLTATLSPDLAFAAGIDPRRERLVLTMLLALVVAVAIKVVGALLITALLIIPAAAARLGAKTPEGMAVLAMGIGALAALGGLQVAVMADTPVGPTIVCAAVAVYVLARVGARLT